MTLIETRADLDWLQEVHGVETAGVEVAILYGNADAPDRVETYEENSVECAPVVWIAEGEDWRLRKQ